MTAQGGRWRVENGIWKWGAKGGEIKNKIGAETGGEGGAAPSLGYDHFQYIKNYLDTVLRLVVFGSVWHCFALFFLHCY